jgi:hypothetical protein
MILISTTDTMPCCDVDLRFLSRYVPATVTIRLGVTMDLQLCLPFDGMMNCQRAIIEGMNDVEFIAATGGAVSQGFANAGGGADPGR